MADQLTRRQAEILAYIRESIASRGFPPTLREIGERVGIRSTNGVHEHLVALEKAGAIVREPLASRAIRVIEPSEATS